MQPLRQMPLFVALLLLACVFLYWPGLSGPLIFDDKPALTANDLVKIDGDVFDEWRIAAFSSDSGPLRRPLAMLSFAANYSVAGEFSPPALKGANLLIHLSVGLLLYFFFREILQTLSIGDGERTQQILALTGTAIWLLHPLNVSTVLYTVQRMAQLASLFMLAGLFVFMRYRRLWMQRGASSGEVLAAVLWLLLMTALAALSKENGLLLPWLIIVLECCIFRGRWGGRENRALRVAGWVALVCPAVLVLSAYLIQPELITAGYNGREFTLEQRVLTQGRLLWTYLSWICVPDIGGMSFQHDDYPLSSGFFAPLTTAIAFAAWVVLLGLSFAFRRRYPLFILAVLFFLVGHSMESTVLPLEMVYEHRNYLPSTLLCLGLASLIVLPVSRSKKIGMLYPVIGVLSVISLLLYIRAQTWSSEITLSSTNLAQHPESSRSNYFHANALLRQYRRADILDLSERERSDSLLLSRHYFERMYQTNNRDIAALVMLFYLDSQFFTEMQDRVDWLAKLDELLETRKLQASDWNALGTLFDIFAANSDVASDSEIVSLLDKLSSRYGDSDDVLRYQYLYDASRDTASPQLLATLKKAQLLAPESTWIYYYLLYESGRADDVAGLYEYARLWMLHDPGRLWLLQLKRLFLDSDSEAKPSS
jgi:protein O-mannosyl-transferase